MLEKRTSTLRANQGSQTSSSFCVQSLTRYSAVLNFVHLRPPWFCAFLPTLVTQAGKNAVHSLKLSFGRISDATQNTRRFQSRQPRSDEIEKFRNLN